MSDSEKVSSAKSNNSGCLSCLVTLAVAVAILAALGAGCSALIDSSMNTVPDLKGMTYGDAKAALKKAGFENIDLEEKNGRNYSWVADDDAVTSQDPKAGEKEFSSSKIKVTVSSRAAELTDYLGGLTGQAVSLVYGKITEYGYTPVYLQDGTDGDISNVVSADVANPNSGYAVAWVLTGVKNIDPTNKTITLTVQSPELLEAQKQAQEAKSELESKLPLSDAWTYMDQSFKKAYPYGFKLHSILGVIKTEVIDANTWHLSAYCDVTNGFGAKMKDRVADAYVVYRDGIISVTNMSVS